MKKNIIKIIFVIALISLIIYIPCVSNAGLIDDSLSAGKSFIETPANQSVKNGINEPPIVNTTKDIYRILMVAGVIVAAGVILVLGILIMTGSIEQKAKAKEMLIPFVVGCVVVFGSLTIWQMVVNVASEF